MNIRNVNHDIIELIKVIPEVAVSKVLYEGKNYLVVHIERRWALSTRELDFSYCVEDESIKGSLLEFGEIYPLNSDDEAYLRFWIKENWENLQDVMSKE